MSPEACLVNSSLRIFLQVLVEGFGGVKDHTTFALDSANTETLSDSTPGCPKLFGEVQGDNVAE